MKNRLFKKRDGKESQVRVSPGPRRGSRGPGPLVNMAGIRDKVAKMEQEMMDKTATHDPQIKSLEVSPSPSTATPCSSHRVALVQDPPPKKGLGSGGCGGFDQPRGKRMLGVSGCMFLLESIADRCPRCTTSSFPANLQTHSTSPEKFGVFLPWGEGGGRGVPAVDGCH